MRSRSSRRAVRLFLIALATSAAPIALLPGIAQEFTGPKPEADPEAGPEVSRNPVYLSPPRRDPMAPAPFFDAGSTPLENQPLRLGNFETANTLPEGALLGTFGTLQTDPSGPGTGNQLYHGSVFYAPTDRLTFGIEYQTYEDPVLKPIGGARPAIGLDTFALTAKYGVMDWGAVSLAGQASIEYLRFDSPLYGGGHDGDIVGSIKLPVTYRYSPNLQFHVTPGVSVLPDEINGTEFYGTNATLGAGVNYRPSQRLGFYGAIETTLGPGGNTISSTGSIEKVPVWTVGGSYNVTPKVQLDLYLTNGIGVTPATSILTHFPEGDEPLIGIRLSYTPGVEYRDSYRGRAAPVTPRDRALQRDGFTLGTANTLEPGAFAARAFYGTDDNYGAALSFSPDRDGEIVVVLEEYADSGPAALTPSAGLRYMVGPKLRFLDQNNGDPLSLSVRGLFGREVDSGTPGVGVFFAEAIAGYDYNDRLSVTANPKLAGFGNTEILGLGLGVNYEVLEGLQLIGEVTPVGLDGDTATWAAGARYELDGSGLAVDAAATNAIGRYGVGSMVASDDVRYTVGIAARFNLR